MEMTTVKTFAVVAVIFGCFAVLYPKIFHPLVLSVFGMDSPATHNGDLGSRLPPHLKKPNMGTARPTSGGGGRSVDDIARHMRAGPHPGMRAAADMQKQANPQGGGGGKGMMTVVLPLYAIGIVLYLIYTLSKVFGGKKQESSDDEYVKRHFKKSLNEVRYDADRKKFMYGEVDSEEEDPMIQDLKTGRKQQRDLERLLFKADREKISDLEMRELKRRLLETESQMTRILTAMESVQDHVGEHMEEGEHRITQEEYEALIAEKENTRPYKPLQKRRINKKHPGKSVKNQVKSMPLRKRNARHVEDTGKRQTKDDLAENKNACHREDISRNTQNGGFVEDVKDLGEGDADVEYSDDFEEQEGQDYPEYVEEVAGETTGARDEAEYEDEESFETEERSCSEESIPGGRSDSEEFSAEERSNSEESIPEEIYEDEEFEGMDEYEDGGEDQNDDEIEDDFDDEEGPTDAELLEKLNSKRGKGKTKKEEEPEGVCVGGEDGEGSDEYAEDVINNSSDKDDDVTKVHQDLRRRKKPPKEK